MKHLSILFVLILSLPGLVSAMTAVNVATTATAALPAADSRRSVAIYNASDTTIYIGNASVTTSNGFPIQPGQTAVLEGNSATDAIYGIHGGSGNKELRYEVNAKYDAGPIVGSSSASADTATGTTTDTPSTAVEDATARTVVSLLKGAKNYLRDLAANIAVASGAADGSTNPLKVAGRYNLAQPTFTDGQRGDLQLGSRGSIRVEVFGAGSAISVAAGSPSDSNPHSNALYANAAGNLFNGVNWDRQRSNTTTVLLASAARTTTQTSADITNYNGRMLRVGLDMTVVGTGSVTLSIEEKDANGIYRTLLASAAISTNVYTPLTIFPGAAATANVSANDFVPRTFRIVVTANNANSATYSVAYSLQ